MTLWNNRIIKTEFTKTKKNKEISLKDLKQILEKAAQDKSKNIDPKVSKQLLQNIRNDFTFNGKMMPTR